MEEKRIILEADLHTHTIASGDGYCTVVEMAEGAERAGLRLLAITDHGCALPSGPSVYHFSNMVVWPRRIHGVEVLRGVEANIMDQNGHLDLPDQVLEVLDLVVAGFHGEAGYRGKSVEDNTRAMVAAIANPYVHIISHPGNPEFPIDYEQVVLAAKAYGKVLELNNKSFEYRPGSASRCQLLANLAKRHGVMVAIDSDAHFADDIGVCNTACELAMAVGIEENQILNASAERVKKYIARQRRKRMVWQSVYEELKLG